MDRVIIVEVLGREGSVSHRVRLDGSASVGRAYDNDVIVDDPFVDPHALVISTSEDGTIVVRDLGTTNGVFGPGGRRLTESSVVGVGDVLRVGRTRFRVMLSSTPVPPTLDDEQGRLSALASRGLALPIALLAFLALWSITSYSNEIDDFTVAVLLTELLGLLVAFAIWAGAWALGTRLASGRAKFGEHATIALAVVTAAMPVALVTSLFSFLWPGDVTDLVSLASGIGIGSLLVYWHLGVASRIPRLRRGVVATSIVLSLVGVGYLAGTIDPEPEAPVQSALGAFLPVPAELIPTAGLDEFLDDATNELASDLEDKAAS